ncbi:MAG: two-partner secretion domain-containing protein [Phycisphaerales bacterium]
MKRKGSRVGHIAHTLMLMSMTAWSVMPAGRLSAAPTGESVQAGSADFARSGNLTQITASNGAIINYQSFNIGAAETVRFIQPDAASRVLNRITGADPTQIDGTLLSNGIVYIVNPAGVYFGQGSLVNVGGIYAGAAQLTNADFLAGIDHFTDVSGGVVNRGTLNGSLIALIGQHVANYGSINAPDGMVTMVAGDDVLIGGADRHFMVRITGMGAAAKQDAAPGSAAAVENHGTINATGGKVVWGAGDVYAMGLFNNGTVKAADVQATATGSDANIGGTIDASNANGAGGNVTVTAKNITVTGTINASGSEGGGDIRIGGDMRGEGDLPTAQTTRIEQGAVLRADATDASGGGNGGSVVVWADDSTYFRGTISAAAFGDGQGGFAEVSGKIDLDFSFAGGIDLRGVNGSAGTLLLDPGAVSVDHAADDTLLTGGTIHDGSINAFLAGDTADLAISTAAGTTGAEDLTSTADSVVSWTTARSLSFTGNNSVTLNGTVAAANAAANFSVTGGSLTVANTVALAGGDFTANGTTYAGNAAVTTSGGAVNITTTGNQTYIAGAVNAGGGDITLTTTGAGNIDEATDNTAAKITTTGTLTIDTITGIGAIGDPPGATNFDNTPLFDVSAGVLDIDVTGAGDINIRNTSAAAVTVQHAQVANGAIRIDSVGNMMLADNAILVANTNAGAGFAWLVSNAGIFELIPGVAVKVTTGTSSNLRIDAVNDVGTPVDPLDVDVSGLWILMDRGDFVDTPGGTGSLYVTNHRGGTLGFPSLELVNGDVVVTTPGGIDFSAATSSGFDLSFTGTGNLTVTATSGDISSAGSSTITMAGGTASLTAGGNIGSYFDGTDTIITPLDITGAGGLALDANAGAGNIFITAGTLTGPLTDIDPSSFNDILINSANTNIDISSDGTDITFNQLQLPTPASPFALAANTLTGDIIVSDNAIVIPMTDTTQSLTIQADAGSITLGSSAIDGGAGKVVLQALGGDITVSNTGPNIISDVTNGGRAELTADGSIGSAGNPVEFQYTKEIVLDVNTDIYVKHDNATDITLLSVAADPSGLPTYSFEDFALESYGDGLLTHILAINDGSSDSLLLNSVVTTSTGTSYSFTSKTGNLYVDDNGAVDALAGIDGAGDDGIFSGTGNVTLQATAGSVLPEEPRAALNVRTTAGITPDGPVVTVRANTSGSGGVNGSIGGDGSGDNFLDISGSRRLVLDARDHMNVRGNGQPLELLDITLDPDGPFVGSPIYSMPGFDPVTFPAANFNVTSDGTDLLITNITSTHTFNPEGAGATEGTSLGVRARTGDIHVINIDVLLQGSDPLLPRSVTLRADLGSIALRDNAIVVGPSGGTAGNGIVRLNAKNTIGEDTGFVNTTVKVTTEGLLEMFANNQAAASQAIGAGADGSNALDAAVGELIAQAGMNLSVSGFGSDVQAVQTGTASGGIFVFDRDTDAQGLKVTNVDTWNGNADLRTAGAMTLADAAVVAGNSAAAAGNGDVTLSAVAGITEINTTAAVNVTALRDQVTLLGQAAIGSSATNGSIDIEAAKLAGQVAVNAGGFFVNDVDTAFADGLTLNAVTDAQLGAIPGVTTSNGAINVATVNNITVTGQIATTTANAVTLTTTGTTKSITFNNAGAVSPGVGGIADTGTLFLITDAVLLNTNAVLRTASASGGSINIGEYASRSATLDSTTGNTFSLNAVADGYLFFSGSIGSTDRLSSLSADSRTSVIYIDGNVFTSGGTQNYYAPVLVMAVDAHFDDTGTSRAAGIHFHSTLDAYLDAGNGYNGDQGLSLTVQRNGTTLDTAGTDPEVPTLSFAANVGDTTPLKWLRLNAFDANADGDFADLGDTDGRSDLPTVATIVVANELSDFTVNTDRANPIDWSVRVQQDFSMGQNEKLTAIGSVTITANTGSALLTTDTGLRLSDINVDRTLTLDAGNTAVLLLNSGRTVLPGTPVVAGPDTGILYPTDANSNGALDEFADDLGLDFWARDGIHILNAASVTAVSGVNPVLWYSVDAGNISGTAGVGSTISLGYFPLITRAGSLGVTVLDLIPVDTAYNLGTIYPPPFPQLDDSIRLALTRHQFMNQLLVLTRDAAGGERLRRTLGNATFDDMSAGGGGRSSNTVLNRIREDMVPLVLQTYNALFYQQTTRPDGSVESAPRFDQLRQTLAAGVAAYSKGAAQPPADPLKFRSYFEQTSESPETLATLNALRELFQQMAQLGLTDREWSNALYAVAAKITPQGVSPDLIVMAALGQPYPAAASAK